MKKRNLLIIFILTLFISPLVYADSLESVRVIKFWDDTDDLVIERNSGERLLIQHNRVCHTMSTEFPMKLIWENNKIVRAKVSSNEICKVYNFGPYSSELKILKRIPASNTLTKEHLAEVEWNGGLYEIDYSKGCRNLRSYVGKIAYIYSPKNKLVDSMLYLPKVKGQCNIDSAKLLKEVKQSKNTLDFPIKNLRFKAENNHILFSWDEFPKDEKWLVQISHSKYPINTNEYSLKQMPKLRRSRVNKINISQLINNQKYYFYVAASNAEGNLSEWKEFEITPIRTMRRIINKVDIDPFEIEMNETKDSYHLTWPDKEDFSRRYLIMVYVDGKRKIFRIINSDKHSFSVPKKEEWSSSRFRMTVRSIPNKPSGQKFFDSIFWRKS